MNQNQIISALMANEDSKIESFESLQILTYTKKGTVIAAIFIGRQAKPYHHYRFDTIEHRQTFIDELKRSETEEVKRELVKIEKWNKDKEKFTPGSVLYSSWGYDQTNIDFYLILERKKDFVIIQQIGSDKTQTGYDSGTCIPNPAVKIGEPFRKKISKYATIKLASFMSAWIYDNEPKGWTSYA